MQYRWVYVPGGAYFFTVNLVERNRTLLVDHIDDLRNAVQKVLTSDGAAARSSARNTDFAGG